MGKVNAAPVLDGEDHGQAQGARPDIVNTLEVQFGDIKEVQVQEKSKRRGL
jgi:hypothetical protein